MITKGNSLLLFILIFVFTTSSEAQITSPGSIATEITNYPTFQSTDNIYIFCTTNNKKNVGVLQVNTNLDGEKTFVWEKYNPQSATFEKYLTETHNRNESIISSLNDGCYRITITQDTSTEIYRAWIINNWISATPEINESNCESFLLSGNFTSSKAIYYDLSDNTKIELNKDIKIEWKNKKTTISKLQNTRIFDIPTQNTEYTLRVYDHFGCESIAPIYYNSIVTKAQFNIDFKEQKFGQLEAPLTVNFINESKNGDKDQYEWFFFKDLEEIKKESKNTLQPIDSIMDISYDENPIFTYEKTGTYMVKLVSKKISENHICTDTFYLPEYIIIDPSFIDAPNVFTPDGNGQNDEFIVLFRSMQSINIQIFNRWGKRIHLYKNNDVRGFGGNYKAAVWDGNINGRKASEGVYYYVVEGTGRDGEHLKSNGFVHLFRKK